MSAPSGDDVEVVLVKAGRTKIRYPAALLHDDGSHIAVRAPWAAPGVRDFGFVRFEPGDTFVEHYWRDRWYAIKEVYAADATLKGWYCDVTRPAVRDGAVLTVEDLDLDLWVSADRGTVLRLDEHEFAESGLAATDPEAATAAVHALDELEALALSATPRGSQLPLTFGPRSESGRQEVYDVP
ncbi:MULTISPECIES: DUF402 domain-containing protein [unclassified Streptomyces]|uniref:DUF402 domain-containing protein n=1 Tax=unclassified Streptomyces TaxID=2593676 RepID=UPI00136FF02A|nr:MULTISPECIES: DUF402 domain-containing protein [unclassified Streptomyces]NEA02946.1 DUF402 domain-containing protein [Streptomyces sp. SID10116]MYY80403.1 DUF402 domain-containing protein [Streptomyces sp. SID335]MYZ16193.1 DUF402 domain-containing protein [Streptomyces sp. SID337]NDZ89144.1 DUF402 domain-containing protein [Streptomyces sp. SID10115]NEB47301.1 DUF402 domain-containing protein [Streptomyces sp. SID339]